ncbi:acetylacetone-cleaving protein [Vineibacter terrae]|uniref:Acetylacetone-cleaving protein n=1 Tax=Vineibacter terrae TaxID=2586908 RepID=A0A5C8PBD4_9HYPH|nr:2,4'-dihydroxyacetophenone dioxygenase family protein [Vineibacter terrae]TXL70740.1 acetylacetone-cleaving protein [Vineibacter terrae]
MSGNTADRDRQRNAQLQDIYIHTSQQPWLQFSPGIEFKVLRATQETGHWTVMFKCAKGSSFARHEHLGAGEYYLISGKLEIRGGVEKGGITAFPGDYGYEPNSIIHDQTEFPEESVLYFTNHGPIRFIDDNDNTLMVLDWQGVLKMEAQARSALGER